MTELDRDFMEALTAGIDRARMDAGDTPGWPFTGKELDNAASSAVATAVLQAPFHRRRAVLVKLVVGLFQDGFFQLAGGDDPG